MTPLCELAIKYTTDKYPFYTPVYYDLFKDIRYKVKKVVEVGIGHPESMYKVKDYITGASLRMWRDFFPNARVYGGDISPKAMFKDDRIDTYICDETKQEDILNLIDIVGTDIDIFIDDAAHYRSLQINLCKTVMPLINKDVIYSIEDIFVLRAITGRLKEYDCYVPELPVIRPYRSSMVIVRNKK